MLVPEVVQGDAGGQFGDGVSVYKDCLSEEEWGLIPYDISSISEAG